MTSNDNTATADGVGETDTIGRPARFEDSVRGEHSAESVLSLTSGAGPKQSQEDCMASQCPPARPVRFDDPTADAAYWARVDAIVAAAPPLTDTQRAVIRTAFHGAATREAA